MSESTTSIGIKSTCNGAFVVTNEGISSAGPVKIKSIGWENDTLVLTGPNTNNTIISGNTIITTSGSSNSQMSIGNFSGMFGGIFGNTIVNESNEIIVDGVKYTRDTKAAPAEDTTQVVDIKWSDTGRSNPVLSDLDVSGKATFDVRIPLDDDCDIDLSGETSVNIHGNNPKSNVTANLSGMGNIVGNGTVSKLTADISGMGRIQGFHVFNMVKVNISGMGNANLTCNTNCNVKKKVTGMGKVNIYPVDRE